MFTIHGAAGLSGDHRGWRSPRRGRGRAHRCSETAILMGRGPERTLLPRLRRESLQRRLLGAADVLAATGALVLVLSLLGQDRLGLAALVGMPWSRPCSRSPDSTTVISSGPRIRRSTRRPVRSSPPGCTCSTVTILQPSCSREDRWRPDRGALARQLHRDRRGTCDRAMAGATGAAGRALPRDRRIAAGRPDPRQARPLRHEREPSSPCCHSRATTSSASAAQRGFAASFTSSRCTASSSPDHH